MTKTNHPQNQLDQNQQQRHDPRRHEPEKPPAAPRNTTWGTGLGRGQLRYGVRLLLSCIAGPATVFQRGVRLAIRPPQAKAKVGRTAVRAGPLVRQVTVKIADDGETRCFNLAMKVEPVRSRIPRACYRPFLIAYPKARTRKFRKAVNPNAAKPRIGRAPSLRFGPNRSRCRANTSFTKARDPNATPSLICRTRSRSICPKLSSPPCAITSLIFSRSNYMGGAR